MGYGGVALMLSNYYRHIDRTRAQFDFVSHGGEEDYHAELRQRGAKIFYIRTMGEIGLVAYLRTIYRLLKDNGPYDAIHIHTNYQAGIVAFAARLAGVKTRICHIRGSYIDEKNRRRLPFYKAMIFANCNRYLACGQDAGRHYYGRRRFEVIPNAVDLSLFGERTPEKLLELRQSLGIAPGDLIVGHVGRFSVEKNHAFLLPVLGALVAEGGRPVTLVLAGEGELRPEIERLAREQGLADRCRFLGNRRDVPDLMSMFDALLLPSVSEGLPNVIVQAQAAGCPCVVSAVITREVDMGLGLVSYLPLGDAGAWAREAKRLAAQPKPDRAAVLERIAAAGFEIRASIARMLAVYDQPRRPAAER